MRTVNEQYAPLLEGTVELLVKCYAAVYHAKLLDSAAHVSVLIICFKKGVHVNSMIEGQGATKCSKKVYWLDDKLQKFSLPFSEGVGASSLEDFRCSDVCSETPKQYS